MSALHKDPIISKDCVCKDKLGCNCAREPGVSMKDHDDLRKIVAELEEKSEVMD